MQHIQQETTLPTVARYEKAIRVLFHGEPGEIECVGPGVHRAPLQISSSEIEDIAQDEEDHKQISSYKRKLAPAFL